ARRGIGRKSRFWATITKPSSTLRRRGSKASSKSSGLPDMTSGSEEDHAAPSRPAIGETIIGAGVLVLAIVMFWQAMLIPVSPLYAKVGPTVVPLMTAAALGLLGVLLLIDAWQGGWQPEEEKTVTPDRAALLWITVGLVPNVVLIGPAGFTIASIILFVCVARGFGSKAIVRDALIGAAFGLIAYFGFATTLGINIGSGLLESAIERAIGVEGSCHGCLPATSQRLCGRAHPDESPVVPPRHHAGHRDRRPSRARPGADHRAAPADHLQGRTDRGVHSFRWHLLRRDVWRLDHVDPAQHAGRERHHRHGARGSQDGAQRPRRRGARDRGHRLVRCRYDWHPRNYFPCARGGGLGAQVRTGGLFLPHGVRVRDGVGRTGLLRRARTGDAVLRHLVGSHRRRPADRPSALHLRSSGIARRHQCRRGGGGSVRGRGDALRRLALPFRQGRDHPALRLALDDARGMEAVVETMAARRRHRFSHRGHARGRRRDPDLPELLRREEALLETAGVRQRRDRRRRRSGGRQQRLGRGSPGADAHA